MHQQRIRPRRAAADLRALGAAIRETRARRGISQERLGILAGTHRNYVGTVERGETNPTFRTLVLFAAGLSLSLPELMLLYERNIHERA